MKVAFAVTASARDTYAFIGGIKANSLVLVTLCGGNHFRFIEESYIILNLSPNFIANC